MTRRRQPAKLEGDSVVILLLIALCVVGGLIAGFVAWLRRDLANTGMTAGYPPAVIGIMSACGIAVLVLLIWGVRVVNRRERNRH